jgi:hypothetical protein
MHQQMLRIISALVEIELVSNEDSPVFLVPFSLRFKVAVPFKNYLLLLLSRHGRSTEVVDHQLKPTCVFASDNTCCIFNLVLSSRYIEHVRKNMSELLCLTMLVFCINSHLLNLYRSL